MKSNLTPETGDVFFSRGDSVLNKLTQWATRARGEPKTLATHEGIFYDSIDVVEATFSGVVLTQWAGYRDRMDAYECEWIIYGRKDPFTHNERVGLWHYLGESIGWQYSRAELGLCFLDGLLGKVVGHDMIVFRRIDLFRHRVICSKTANRPLVKIREFPQDAYFWTPDDTCDFLAQSPEWFIRDTSLQWDGPVKSGPSPA